MKSNTLIKLKDKFPVASAKPGNNCVVFRKGSAVFNPVSKTYHIRDLTLEEFNERVWSEIVTKYNEVTDYNSKYIDKVFTSIYGKPIPVRNKGEVVTRLKEIRRIVGKPMEQIAWEVKKYVGNSALWRIENKKRVIIRSDRILKAYEMIQNKEKVDDVKKILYF